MMTENRFKQVIHSLVIYTIWIIFSFFVAWEYRDDFYNLQEKLNDNVLIFPEDILKLQLIIPSITLMLSLYFFIKCFFVLCRSIHDNNSLDIKEEGNSKNMGYIEKKEQQKRLMDLRLHMNNMDLEKRILLTDGRIGIFKGYGGGLYSGDTFSFEEHGVIQEVPLELYDCVLVDDPNLKCSLCSGERIMNGLLRNSDGTFSAFREMITSDKDKMPTFNSRSIILHACRDCGYIMPFVGIRKSN